MGYKEYLKEDQFNRKIAINEFFASIFEGKFSLNVANVPLQKAKEYSTNEFKNAGKSLESELPNFDKHYKLLQNKMKQAKTVKRIDMPVIEPDDMQKFKSDLSSGRLDIFKPFVKGIKDHFPKDLNKEKGKDWVTLGTKDGNKTDDIVKAQFKMISAKDLLPSQNEIWLENTIPNIVKYGKATKGGIVTKTPIIVTKDGYILDGHHRFSQVLLSDPNIKMKSLFIPISFDELIKIGRSYGNALGNKQKG